MGVLADLADQGFSVTGRHRIIGLDLLLGIDARLKRREEFRRLIGFAFGIDQPLSVHVIGLPLAQASARSLANLPANGKPNGRSRRVMGAEPWSIGLAALHHHMDRLMPVCEIRSDMAMRG